MTINVTRKVYWVDPMTFQPKIRVALEADFTLESLQDAKCAGHSEWFFKEMSEAIIAAPVEEPKEYNVEFVTILNALGILGVDTSENCVSRKFIYDEEVNGEINDFIIDELKGNVDGFRSIYTISVINWFDPIADKYAYGILVRGELA
jgi:hypothetical protein